MNMLLPVLKLSLALLAAIQYAPVAAQPSPPGSTITSTKRLVDVAGCAGPSAPAGFKPASADLHGGITDDCILQATIEPEQM